MRSGALAIRGMSVRPERQLQKPELRVGPTATCRTVAGTRQLGWEWRCLEA